MRQTTVEVPLQQFGVDQTMSQRLNRIRADDVMEEAIRPSLAVPTSRTIDYRQSQRVRITPIRCSCFPVTPLMVSPVRAGCCRRRCSRTATSCRSRIDGDLVNRIPSATARRASDMDDYPRYVGWDPYNQNVLKGDYPITGQHTFLNVTASTNPLPGAASADADDTVREDTRSRHRRILWGSRSVPSSTTLPVRGPVPRRRSVLQADRLACEDRPDVQCELAGGG